MLSKQGNITKAAERDKIKKKKGKQRKGYF